MLRGYRRREREERRGEKGEGGELEENLITRHFPLLFIDDVSKQRIAMKVLAEVLTKGQESLGYFYEEYSVGICIWYLAAWGASGGGSSLIPKGLVHTICTCVNLKWAWSRRVRVHSDLSQRCWRVLSGQYFDMGMGQVRHCMQNCSCPCSFSNHRDMYEL